jgi:GNAT superfamily N-acetyltransferase
MAYSGEEAETHASTEHEKSYRVDAGIPARGSTKKRVAPPLRLSPYLSLCLETRHQVGKDRMSRLVPSAAPVAWCTALSAIAAEPAESADCVAVEAHTPVIRLRKIIPDRRPADTTDCAHQHDEYRIRLMRTREQRKLASALIARMYSSRGYDAHVPSAVTLRNDSVTFGAYSAQRLCGTLTLGFDFDSGLMADTLYRCEIDAFREHGSRVCELSRFAVDPDFRSKDLLASLFEAACMHALSEDMDIAVIEVNPRHVAFYKRMLGFTQVGEIKTCPRVNAPAALLHVDVKYVAGHIRRYAIHGMAARRQADQPMYAVA